MQITCEWPDDVLTIGTKVFIPRPVLKSAYEDEIMGYYCVLVNEGDKQILHPTDYRLSTLNLSSGSALGGWKRSEFFLSYEEAVDMAVMFYVHASKDIWYQAIGLNGDQDRTSFDEDCELAPCCANISAVRNLLLDCMNNGLTGVERRDLLELLNSHERATIDQPNLNQILSQLHIHWEGDEYVIKNANKTDDQSGQANKLLSDNVSG